MISRLARSIALLALVLPTAAAAVPITANTFVNSGQYAFDADLTSQNTGGPISRDLAGNRSFVWTSSIGNSVFDSVDTYGLADNGFWTSGRVGFAGTNSDTATMSFAFDQGTNGVGGLVNYAAGTGGSDTILSVFGRTGNLLETFNLTQDAAVSTPGATGAGGFRGFSRAESDIFRFDLTGNFVVIDDLVVGKFVAPVPLPGAAPLLALGLGLLFLAARRRRA